MASHDPPAFVDGRPSDWPAALQQEYAGGWQQYPDVIDVIGDMRNMMGPHSDEGLPIASTWEKCPPCTPPGDQYRAQPSGLLEMPVLLARHR